MLIREDSRCSQSTVTDSVVCDYSKDCYHLPPAHFGRFYHTMDAYKHYLCIYGG